MIRLFIAILSLAFAAPSAYGQEETGHYFGGSIGGEVWYADWSSENQWAKEGVHIEYDIKPSLLHSYHSNFVLFPCERKFATNIAFDYLSSNLNKDNPEDDPHGADDHAETYRRLKFWLEQRVGDGTYLHAQVTKGEFDGTVRVAKGGRAFDPAKGDSFPVHSTWFKADTAYLKEGKDRLYGFGLRYISYNKPETVSLFVANGPTEGLATEGDLISGEVEETTFRGYYVTLGVYDKGLLGIPTDSPLFLDGLVYVGMGTVENSTMGNESGLGGGVEASGGLKYGKTFGNTVTVVGRLGYRVLYNKISVSKKDHTDENGDEVFHVTETVDLWHGPFLGVTVSF